MVYWKLPFMLAKEEVLGQVSGLNVLWTLRASIDYGYRAHRAESTDAKP